MTSPWDSNRTKYSAKDHLNRQNSQLFLSLWDSVVVELVMADRNFPPLLRSLPDSHTDSNERFQARLSVNQ